MTKLIISDKQISVVKEVEHVEWGAITGNLSNQTDLNAALEGKTSKQETAALEGNISQVQALAQTNELKIGTKADQI